MTLEMAGAGAPQEASKTPLEGVFCVRQAAALHWRDWGDDSVVYDAYSGQTHQFSPLAAAVMACFEQHACSLDDLAVAIAGDLGVPVDNELRSALRPIVEEFHRLGWIEPTDPIHPS